VRPKQGYPPRAPILQSMVRLIICGDIYTLAPSKSQELFLTEGLHCEVEVTAHDSLGRGCLLTAREPKTWTFGDFKTATCILDAPDAALRVGNSPYYFKRRLAAIQRHVFRTAVTQGSGRRRSEKRHVLQIFLLLHTSLAVAVYIGFAHRFCR